LGELHPIRGGAALAVSAHGAIAAMHWIRS